MSSVRPLTATDRDRLATVLTHSWGSTEMDTRGRLVDALALPGYIAVDDDGAWLGYLVYESRDDETEVIALAALSQGQGAGTALLASCVRRALEAGAARLWLLTSNDNMAALRFYQRRGFVLAALHRDAITRARGTLKPELPLFGIDGIALRDEIELELPLDAWPRFVELHSWPT